MRISKTFTPVTAGTVNIDVSGSSQRVSLALTNANQVRIYNDGTATVWIDFGDSTITASTTASMPFPAGAVEDVTPPNCGTTLYVAAIAAGATGKIYFTPGTGI